MITGTKIQLTEDGCAVQICGLLVDCGSDVPGPKDCLISIPHVNTGSDLTGVLRLGRCDDP